MGKVGVGEGVGVAGVPDDALEGSTYLPTQTPCDHMEQWECST